MEIQSARIAVLAVPGPVRSILRGNWLLADKPHPDSEVEFWHVGNLTACGTSPSQGEV